MESFRYARGSLSVLDQLLVPASTEFVDVNNTQDAWQVIRDMRVRGAPLIAIVAALGLAVDAAGALASSSLGSAADAAAFLVEKMDHLRTSRPTAVNLFNAMDALQGTVRAASAEAGATASSVLEAYLAAAEAMPAADVAANKAIGRHGAEEIVRRCPGKDKLKVLHICNTGTLATAGYGTALGIARALKEMGKLDTLYIMETRPYLQGARLTAYEAVQDGLNGVLIPDSAVAFLMARKGVDACVAGADRVTNNGDTANKIGTYTMSLCAQSFGIPVVIAAPSTTVDVSLSSGEEIVIEERKAHELKSIKRMPNLPEGTPDWLPIAPPEVGAWNPAFDVTPASLISAIATERGCAAADATTGSYDLASFLARPAAADGADGAATPSTVLEQARSEGYPNYRRLDEAAAKAYLVRLAAAREVLGTDDPAALTSEEVGDGNLNLVFIVAGPSGAVVLKQALPYVRCVGEQWPLTLRRASFEHEALVEEARLCPEHVPRVFHFDRDLAAIVMRYIEPPHLILRKALVKGERFSTVARDLGTFLAKTLFGTSTLALPAGATRAAVQRWAQNDAMCGLTEQVIFTEPYFDAENNRSTPGLEDIVAEIRGDAELKRAAGLLKHKFMHQNEALIHGDLHTGSVMAKEGSTLVIDPEFAFYGPMGFDIGAVVGNFLLNFYAADGRGLPAEHKDWVLSAVQDIWGTFAAQFKALWAAKDADGDGFRRLADADGAKDAFLARVLEDAIGFAGAKMLRRVVGIAHVEDLDGIEDEAVRAACERKALRTAMAMMKGARQLAAAGDLRAVVDLARAD